MIQNNFLEKLKRKIFNKKFLIGIGLLFLLFRFPIFLFFLLLILLIYFYIRFLKRKENELKKLCQDFYQGQEFVAIDLETTGLNSRKDEIIEIAAIKFNKKGERESFIRLIKPKNYVPFEIQEMTGVAISKLMEEGRNLEEIKEEFISFIKNLPILGWNLSFDLDFLKNNGIKLSNQTIDVMEIAYNFLPPAVYRKGRKRPIRRRFSLSSIARDFGIYIKETHRAGTDAFLVCKVFEKLMEQIKYKYFREET